MAKVDIKMPDKFTEKLSRLGNRLDDVAEKVLEAGGAVVLDKAKANLEGVIGAGTKYESRSHGDLAAALGLSPVKVGNDGNHNIKIGFSEPHPGGVSNAMPANILEYGKSNQPARPFMKPAKTTSRKQAVTAMQDALEKEVGQ